MLFYDFRCFSYVFHIPPPFSGGQSAQHLANADTEERIHQHLAVPKVKNGEFHRENVLSEQLFSLSQPITAYSYSKSIVKASQDLGC